MSLYKQWEEIAYKERTQEDYDNFWEDYLKREQKIYEYILGEKQNYIGGKVSDLASRFDMDNVAFGGFLYGINTSLVKELDLETVSEESEISLDIDFEKLYYNMLDANASWLYELKAWDGILSEERRKEITKEFNRSKIVIKEDRVGRNDPCPCGSGKKYKKCCGQ